MKTKVFLPDLIGKGYATFWNFKGRYRVVKGSRASKKSKTSALWYIVNMMAYPQANTLVVRKTYRTIKDSVFAELKWAIHQLGVEAYWEWKESPLEMTYTPTGQKIYFRGLDDPLKLTSISVDKGELSWVLIEEAYEIDREDHFDMLDESIRGRSSPGMFKQITLIFNPWNENHWIKSRFFDAEPSKDILAMTTNYKINEWLDDADLKVFERMKEHNPRRYQIAGLGEWGVAEGLVFDNFEVRDFDISDTIKRVGETTAGLDFGFTHDPTTFPRLAVDLEEKEIYIYAEHYEHGMTTDDIYQMIVNSNMQNAFISADSAEQRLIAELRNKGIRRIQPSIKGAGSVNAGIDFMKRFTIIIHPDCEKTIEEFNTYAYQRDRMGNWLNRPEDANNHIIDAIRYSLERYHLTREKVNVERRLQQARRLFN